MGAYESILYTDAHVTGEQLDGLGPYMMFNALGAVGLFRVGAVGAGVALRVESHLSEADHAFARDHERTDTTHYVGATTLSDMFAALLSLALGARFRSGGEIRSFSPDSLDPRGRPEFHSHAVPYLVEVSANRSVIPRVAGRQVDLGEALSLLAILPELSAASATDLLRAARLYRQALWVADDDPELSWLLLVSAMEVGALHWVSQSGEPQARLEDAMPVLAQLLIEKAGEEVLEEVAAHLADLVRATNRFTTFAEKFAGDPPADRPSMDWMQADWSRIKQSASKIYAARSSLLHAGVPWPAPLLHPPFRLDDSSFAEKPLGLSSAAASGVWVAKDLPMTLDTFAHLARETLVGWWRQIASQDESE